MIKKGIIFVFLIKISVIFTQNTNIFNSKSINEMEDIFNSFEKKQGKIIAVKYLNEAKQEQDYNKIIKGYYLNSLANSHSSIAVNYADSIIKLSKKIKNENWLTNGYIQKGVQLYYTSENTKALSCFIKVKERSDDKFNSIVTDHYIGLLKNSSEQEKEALNIFKTNIVFFNQEENQRKYSTQYLKSLYALADSYTRNNQLDSAQIMSIIGINKSYNLENKILYPHFLHSLSGSFYSKKKYGLALDSLKKAIPLLESKPKSLCSVYNLFSLIYQEVNDEKNYIKNLKKIDSIYDKHKSVIFYAKEANMQLSDFYKNKRENEKHMYILEKILSIDSIINEDHSELGEKIIKQYDIPKLVKSKERLIGDLQKKQRISNKYLTLSIFVILLIILILVYYVRNNIIYKRRFNKVLNSENIDKKSTEVETKKIFSDTHSSQESIISEDVVNKIITKLQKFEEQSKFTKTYTLTTLAKELKTNSTYLSKVINEYKKTNFSNYLNSLRVDFAIKKLKNDKKFRSFTIEAIANEVGFNTAQSFSNAFYKKTGIYPSYFIKNLKSNK